MKIENTEHQESTNPPFFIASVIGRFLCSIDLHWWKKTGKYKGMLVNGKFPHRYTCKRCDKTKNVAWV